MIIHSEPIKEVSSYKYLGVHLDSQLRWGTHVDSLCSRLKQRLYFLRRLRSYGVDKKIMLIFYQAVLESIVRYGMSAWYGNLNATLKAKLTSLTRTANKVIGRLDSQSLQALYEQSVLRLSQGILSDPSHILYPEFELLPHGRRYRAPIWRYVRYRDSFVPNAVRLLNGPN